MVPNSQGPEKGRQFVNMRSFISLLEVENTDHQALGYNSHSRLLHRCSEYPAEWFRDC